VTAKAGHPLTQVEEERLAGLLAIVADIYAGLGLQGHDAPHGLAPQLLDLRIIDRLALIALRV
jgi:hypothetical protein